MSDCVGTCDGCGAIVALDQLSLVTFIELEGFACEECRRDTVVAALSAGNTSHKRGET